MLYGIAVLYAACIALLIQGLKRLPLRRERTDFRVSVIVAAHNEADRIEPLLECLAAMDYPDDRWEAVIVDDRSTDGTADIVQQFIREHPHIRLLQITDCPPGISPKKHAIVSALAATDGDIIVTTDADCRPGPGWLKNIVGAFRKDVGVVIGFSPVVSRAGDQGFLEGFQWLDSLSLAAMAAGAAGWFRGLTACGRNFAYRRTAFEQVDGFGSAITIGSGDDDLLMHRILNHTSWRPGYAQGERAVVPTEPYETLMDLLQSRVRHASKMLYYPIEVQSVALMLFLVNVITAGCMIALVFGHVTLMPLVFLAVKGIADYWLLQYAMRILYQGPGLGWYPVAAALHPFYVIGVALFGLREKYWWKDRKYGQ